MARMTYVKTGLGIVALAIIVGVIRTAISMHDLSHKLKDGEVIAPNYAAESVQNIMFWTMLTLPVIITGLTIMIMGIFLKPKVIAVTEQ